MLLRSEPHVRRRREPERDVLHQALLTHLETFLERTRAPDSGHGLPRFVERELRRYLECGLLAHGFARVHCPRCMRDELEAFACKGRGFCPSCCGRRMADTAAHLVDHVLPHAPVRQWVLSFPFRIRFLLALGALVAGPSSCGASSPSTSSPALDESGPRRLIAQPTDPIVVRKILAHLGHPTEPPRPAPARSREQIRLRLSRRPSLRRARSSPATRAGE